MEKLLIANIILIVAYTNIKIPVQQVQKEFKQEINQEIIQEEIKQLEIKKEPLKNTHLEANTDLRIKSNLTIADYDKMLNKTNLIGLGKAFKEAEDKHNINGMYLMGLACLESAYGKSSFAINRNNLFGWCAYDRNPNGASYFDSKEECILHVASKLQKNYLSDNGRYFEGYTGRDIDKHYCSDKQHIDKIVNIVNKLKKEI